MKSYSEILAKVEPKIVIPRCKPNTHELEFAGGSSNGRPLNDHAPVYKCIKCNQFGYKENFDK